ncbi:DNA replication/repair protein RecF [Erysipelothrix sp. HDW6C]|uniref:DNA replication/repair protein RecF n=1 Tax=Erysipelothrix sp. HDW6C TaxID=2714930 RepID=UPI001F0F07CC|nr:DNA replication/repair protein RecF [Erysipelothrix sp. HDW6C]
MKLPAMMRVNQLTLQQFRNVSQMGLDFPHNLTVFIGDNGQGKTNIIESLVFLSSGRSFRVNDDRYLIQDKKQFAKIDAILDSKHRLGVVISEQGKFLQVNQNVIKKLSDFIGYCNVVLFNPDDLNFFTDAPRKRRRDVDFELGKISKDYLAILSRYTRVLSERNAYLKSKALDTDYLEVITDELVSVQIPIIKQRNAFRKRIEPRINHYYQMITQQDVHVTLDYRCSVSPEDEDIKTSLHTKMKESLRRDQELRMTQVGIHRDDFVFKVEGIPVVNVSSQGQKRMLMIAYKLALVDLIFESQGYYPILCLDDLFSELDETRRKLVIEILPAAMQVFITTTDLRFIMTERELNVFDVRGGHVHKEGN